MPFTTIQTERRRTVTILHGSSEISDVALLFRPYAHPTYNKAWQFGLLLTAFCKFYPDDFCVIAGRNVGAVMAPPPVTDTRIVDFASCYCGPSLALFSYQSIMINKKTGSRVGTRLSVAGEGPATFQKETCRTCDSGRIQPVQQRAHYANHPYREQSPMTACQPCQVVIHWPFRQRFQSESCSNYNDRTRLTIRNASAARWRLGNRGIPGCARRL